MSITITIVHALEQLDGSKLVYERYTDAEGIPYPRFYIADPGTNIDAEASAYAIVLESVLAEKEADEVIQ